MIKNLKQPWLSALLLSSALILSACGGGSSSSGSGESPNGSGNGNNNGNENAGSTLTGQQTGQFIDSPVDGLSYQAAPSNTKGFTENGGFFYFEAGDEITFTVAGIDLPTVKAATLISPNSFGASSSPVALNIGLLLLSLDSDDNPDNGISLNAVPAFNRAINFQSDSAAFHSVLIALAQNADHKLNAVTTGDVEAHFAKQCWFTKSCLTAVRSDDNVLKTSPSKGIENSSTVALDADNNVLYLSVSEYIPSQSGPRIEISTIYRYALTNEGKIDKTSKKTLRSDLPFSIASLTYHKGYLYLKYYGSYEKGIKVYNAETSTFVQTLSLSDYFYNLTIKNDQLYVASSNAITRYNLANGEIVNGTEQILTNGKEFLYSVDGQHLYMIAGAYNNGYGAKWSIEQYKINNGSANLKSTLTLNTIHENAELPRLTLANDQLLVAFGGYKSYGDEDYNCLSSIGWLYSIDIKNGDLGSLTPLTQAEVSFQGGLVLAPNKQSAFASYVRYGYGSCDTDSTGIMQFDLIQQ